MANWKEPPGNNLLEFARTANAGAPKRRSAPPSARPAPPIANVAAAPVAPSIPQDSGHVMLALAPPAPSYASASAYSQVAAPLAKPSRAGVVLVATAGVIGFVVSLYRNDVLYGLTHASRWEHPYLQFEQALGSPAFGTPRSLDGLVHAPPAVKPPEAPTAAATLAANPVDSLPAPSPPPETSKAAAEPAREAEPAPKGHARAVAVAPKRVHAAAKHAAAESDDAPPKAAPPERHEESPKKAPDAKKAPEPKEAAPSLSLDDAIKASMDKKGH